MILSMILNNKITFDFSKGKEINLFNQTLMVPYQKSTKVLHISDGKETQDRPESVQLEFKDRYGGSVTKSYKVKYPEETAVVIPREGLAFMGFNNKDQQNCNYIYKGLT